MHPYARGSEWRKWDLHIHTPASHGYHGTYDDLIKQINGSDCHVVGINDYCSIEGYKQLKASKKVTKPMFPVVEFRMNNTIGHRDGVAQTNLNFHVIFNPELSVSMIENFIGGTDYINAAGNEDKISNVEGAENLLKVSLDYFSFLERLESNEKIKGNYLVWLPYDEYGGIDGIDPQQSYFKPSLINKAHIIGSGNAKQISFFLWDDEKFTRDQYQSWFSAPMPCIKGSDCHKASERVGNLRDANSEPTDRYCWIKADPTFEGLRQITIEPRDRVFIGDIPPKLLDVEQNKSKYIDAISVYPKTSELPHEWFNDEIPLNAELVAIIGKKGSGKSALADILALAGRSHAESDTYSFLHGSKFWEKKGVPDKYEAKLQWMDGKSEAYHLHETVSLTEVERVKYLPQKHVEHLCNQFGVGDSFQKEINKIVFSYVEDSEKLGSSSLEELIQKKTAASDKEVMNLRGKLTEKLGRFIFLEKKQDKAYLEGLKNKLQEKKRELESIELPPVVEKPKADIDPKAKERLDKIVDEITGLNKQIDEANAKLTATNTDIQIASNIEAKLAAFEMGHDELKTDIQPDAEKLGLKIEEMISFKIDRKSLGAKKRSLNLEKEKLSALLDQKDEKSLTAQKATLEKELTEITSKLDQQNKNYQKYQQNLKAYNERIAILTGKDDDTTLETIASIEKEIVYVDQKLEADLKKRRTK